jgi:hypothetical protein
MPCPPNAALSTAPDRSQQASPLGRIQHRSGGTAFIGDQNLPSLVSRRPAPGSVMSIIRCLSHTLGARGVSDLAGPQAACSDGNRTDRPAADVRPDPLTGRCPGVARDCAPRELRSSGYFQVSCSGSQPTRLPSVSSSSGSAKLMTPASKSPHVAGEPTGRTFAAPWPGSTCSTSSTRAITGPPPTRSGRPAAPRCVRRCPFCVHLPSPSGSGRRKARVSEASAEPSHGLEPWTPSLPWKCSTS